MKKLLFANQEFEADRIVKTNDSIVGYTDGSVIFKFSGVSDFSEFTLADGQEFDASEPTDKERIEQLEREKSTLQLQVEALTGQTEFLEEALSELILTVVP